MARNNFETFTKTFVCKILFFMSYIYNEKCNIYIYIAFVLIVDSDA